VIVCAVHHGVISMMFEHYQHLYEIGNITLFEFVLLMIKSVHLTWLGVAATGLPVAHEIIHSVQSAPVKVQILFGFFSTGLLIAIIRWFLGF